MTYARAGKLTILIDGQFGSTGKGLMAAYVGERQGFDWYVTTASPNAGHTAYIDGKKVITYHLPMAALLNPGGNIFLNAGSIIDPKAFADEMAMLGVDPGRVRIHPRAVLVTPEDVAHERSSSSAATKLGSTQKGVGASLARKVMREATLAGDFKDHRLNGLVDEVDLSERLHKGETAFLEVPQGFSLGINSGLAYPHCTSKEVTVSQGLSDCGLHPRYLGPVIMTARTFPIRVGHIYDKDGVKIGDSGPGYSDQYELTWEQVGVAPEITTVTKRERRIFTWSNRQYADAVQKIRPDMVFLNFVNYLSGWANFRALVESMAGLGAAPTHFGVGPLTSDVYEDFTKVAERLSWK